MTEQPPEKLGWPDLPRAIALMVLAGISGFVVWSFHNEDWPVFAAAVVVSGFFGCLAGGLVGVHIFPSLATMTTFCGIVEGICQGWTYYRWGGAILGGFIGIIAASIVVMLPIMLIHLAFILRGLDPFARPDGQEQSPNESL